MECREDALSEMLELRKELAGIKAVITSPSRRCMRTAEALGLSYEPDKRLLELNFGEWELRSWEEIYNDSLSKSWFDNYLDVSPPGGETLRDLHLRVGDFLSDLQNREESKVCIIGHAGSIRSIIAHLRGIPLTHFFSISVPLGSLIRVFASETLDSQES